MGKYGSDQVGFLLLDGYDLLGTTTELTDQTWQRLAARYDEKQLLEFIILVGWYRMISSLCNALRLPAEAYHPPHPSRSGY